MRLIDADELKKLRHDCIQGRIKFDGNEYDIIDKCPTIEAEPVRHGRWVGNRCTECGERPMGTEVWESLGIKPPRFERFMDYCPCCGAKMDGVS